MKKLTLIALTTLLLLTFTACFNSLQPEQEAESPIKVEELSISAITIEEPDSIGNVYMSGTYTNNSQYVIQSMSLSIHLKDSNETTYLSSSETVLPGETSTSMSTFGPDSGSQEDFEIVAYRIEAVVDDKDYIISYDCKLDTYTFYEDDF